MTNDVRFVRSCSLVGVLLGAVCMLAWGASAVAQIAWTQHPSTFVLDGGGRVPAATDLGRGRAILFGGNRRAWQGTWEWDGARFARRDLPASPTPRELPGVATNVNGAGVLVFGGWDVAGFLGDTWSFDGAGWAQLTPAHSPPAGLGTTMVFDSVRNQVVLLHFDGTTWVWDGLDWAQRFPTSSPSPRYEAAMAFDPVRGRAVLFGGAPNAGDTWEWDGSNWQQASPSSSPTPRADAGMAFDPVRQRVLLHGGTDNSGQAFDDTWEWDGTDWTPISTPGPTGYQRAALVLDPLRGRLLLTRSGPDDAWEWSGTAWTRLTPILAPAEDAYGRSLEYDPVAGITVCFGGRKTFGPYVSDETWSWDGVAWSRHAPTASPTGRCFASLVSTSQAGGLLLFGGADGQRRPLGDTWSWRSSGWQQRQPSLAPAPRYGHGAAYDPRRDRLVLFGGTNGTTNFGDTWEWDGSQWSQPLPQASPVARRGAFMAWHEGRARVVLFGGGDLASLYLNDTWEWDGVTWTLVPTAASPTPRRSGHMTYDRARDRCVLFGGQGLNAIKLDDVWEFDGSDWRQRTTTQSPSPRIYGALAYDTGQRRVMLFGGISEYHGLADTWTLSPETPATFTAYGSGCPGSGGIPVLTATPGELPWLGATLGLTVTPVPGAFFVFLGASRTTWSGVPLPLGLGFLGMTGCALAASPDVTLAGLGNGGVGRLSVPIPNVPTLLGGSLFTQAVLPETATLAVVSNGGEFRMGER